MRGGLRQPGAVGQQTYLTASPQAPRVHTGPGAAACAPRPRALHGAGRGGCHSGDTLNLRLPPLKARRARAAFFVRCRAAGRAMPRHRPGVVVVAAAAVAVTVAGGDRRDTRAEWGRGGPRRSARTPAATALRTCARARARGLPVRAATQKCRRAKRLTPAWPPPPSPSAPPSSPGPACRGGDGREAAARAALLF